jgi:hypothetical protein
MIYEKKYLKYKTKYLELKKQLGGTIDILHDDAIISTMHQIDNCKDMIKYASQNKRIRNLTINELSKFYPKLRDNDSLLPDIPNINWDQFVDICHMIDRLEHFFNNGGSLNKVPIKNDFVNIIGVNIDLKSRGYTDADLELFYSLLLIRNNIHIIDLGNNQITDIGPLAYALYNSPYLTSVSLSNNKINNINPLKTAFYNNPKLEIVNLYNNQISDITPLSIAFRNNPNLERVSLSKNQISNIYPLQDAFQNNIQFESVGLDYNDIIDINPLAIAFQHNPNFENLYLSNNHVEDISPLYDAFQNNPNLTFLRLHNNDIKNINILANAFHNNPKLTKIDLSNNLIENQIHINGINIIY